jgi:hypothetical protein
MPIPVAQISIHEDDEGMRNLYPMAARTEADADMKAAIDASARNRAPDGVGWTDVHLIEPPKTTFADVGLTLAAVVAALEPLMPRVRRFICGGGDPTRNPFAYRDDGADCFGFDESCFIKLEATGDLVEAIWYEARTENAEELAALRKALHAIDALTPALIADYWLDTTGPVADPAFMDAYFKALGGT